MKLLKLVAPAAVVAIFIFSGCKKDDVTSPVITLVGTNPLSTNMVTAFADPGATAVDDVDGDLSSEIVATGTVKIDSPGVYVRTYTVSDAAGNVGTATRSVNVLLTRDGILGNYHTTNTCSAPYSNVATTTAFQTNSSANKFVINMFYYNGGTLTCSLSGSNVTVDAGQAPNPLLDGVTGSGTISTNGKTLNMNYTFQPNGAAAVNCTVAYTRL